MPQQTPTLVLKNGTVVNVLSGELQRGDVAIAGKTILGIGNYSAPVEIDCTGQFILPGFIDTHVHVESSKLSPQEFAKYVLAAGTTTVVADPHEIANVLGMDGVYYIKDELGKTPLNALVMLPSCVPATPFETAGAVIDSKTIAKHIENFDGLGEFMNFPGIINNDPECMAKIRAAQMAGKIIDGHVMSVAGEELDKYVASGAKTNHECITPEYRDECLQRGLYIQMRHGTFGKNVRDLVKGLTPQKLRRCLFCTDDKYINETFQNGHITENVRIAVEESINPIDAVTIATLNAAECYGLEGRGAIAPGWIADILVVDNLKDFNAKRVFASGQLVAENGKAIYKTTSQPQQATNSVKLKRLIAPADFALSLTEGQTIINFTPGAVVTEKAVLRADSSPAKISVIERHKATGNIGNAWIQGFGLEAGAIASTVAHDSHNICVVSRNDHDAALAANELAKVGGGLAVANDGKILELLPLPYAGLMTDISAEELMQKLESLDKAAQSLGIPKTTNAFIELSFLALPVIPSVRITDKGLFDVDKFEFVK